MPGICGVCGYEFPGDKTIVAISPAINNCDDIFRRYFRKTIVTYNAGIR